MNALDLVADPLREFSTNSIRFVNMCHKPDREDYKKVATRTAVGLVVMGFVGFFFLKLSFIPINIIIVGAA